MSRDYVDLLPGTLLITEIIARGYGRLGAGPSARAPRAISGLS